MQRISNNNSFIRTTNSTMYHMYLVGNITYSLNFTSRFISNDVCYLIGARIRQLRMPAERCKLPVFLQQYFSNCIYEYSGATEETTSYPIGWNRAAASYIFSNVSGNGEFLYHMASILEGDSEQMTLGTYGGGGYIGDLGKSLSSAVNMLQTLSSSQWIEIQTRLINVECLLFNPTTNLFSRIQIGFEFFAGGSIITALKVFSFKFDNYTGSKGISLILFQNISLVFIVIYIFRVMAAVIKQKISFFLVFKYNIKFENFVHCRNSY